METKRRHHFEWNAIKKSIIEFVLNAESPVNEPGVSEFLKGKYGEFTRSTINKHLRALGELGCIESIPVKDKSKFNYWNIRSIKNLKNIKDEFPNIELKSFTKSLKILLEELDTEGFVDISNPMECRRFEIQLSLSDSYFSYLLNTDLKTFRENVHNLNSLGKDLYLNNVHTGFTELITFAPNIVFQHFYEHDILNGVVSNRENIFVMETKLIMRSYEAYGNEKIKAELDKFYVKFCSEPPFHEGVSSRCVSVIPKIKPS